MATSMIVYKTNHEVDLIKQNCMLVSKTLAEVAKEMKPGVSGKKLDQMAETFIRDHGAEPGFKGLYDFPATLCFSINEEVVHGIPSDREVKEGDVVSVDCGVLNHGYYGDAAFTFAIGEVAEEVMELLRVTRKSLALAIEQAKVGKRLGDIGFAVQDFAEKQHGFGVVRDLVGHGIGQQLHEKPEVKNYGRRGTGNLLKDGLTIAIEPMINQGTWEVRQAKDGWTIVSRDGKPSAHYEHSVAILKSGTQVLSDHSIIDKEIKNNSNLAEISIKK